MQSVPAHSNGRIADSPEDLRRKRGQEVRQEPMRQSQPIVVPVVINQNERAGNPLGVSQDDLRDIVGQAVSTQLSLLQMRGDDLR